MRRAPIVVFDNLNQSAPMLIPFANSDQLLVVDFRDYRRNFLLGPKHVDQLQWIRAASVHLVDSLALEPVQMNALLAVCEELVNGGHIVSVPAILERIHGTKNPTLRSIENRLLPLVMTGLEVFRCERGFDIEKMLENSAILYLKDAAPLVRKLIINDLYFYRTQTSKVRADWRLQRVLFFHESASLISRMATAKTARSEPFVFNMVREARNYLIGLVFADQTPQFEHTVIRSNIGTRLVFRLDSLRLKRIYFPRKINPQRLEDAKCENGRETYSWQVLCVRRTQRTGVDFLPGISSA